MVKLIGLVERDLNCPDYRKRGTLDTIREYVKRENALPLPCSECYTAILYVAQDTENLERFSRLLTETFEAVEPRQYERVYIRLSGDNDKNNLVEELTKKLQEYDVNGRVEWRRCCRKIAKEFPCLFKDAKTFAEVFQLRMEL